ncbi:uncharacterized protein DUF1566 [Desulfobotulus alkaliphilus]|uniref:Uncharacterized protein DUF1566 n=1 Tax=Desulfobotulus alkaliphilus TaxID=622671 RepID=A0A562S0F3_9BACT|nr:DUF1566 domain-containing protein [Desulfobotulus alkaliphilus]TWI73980.1 uncharacterized protein DUF1566 [Desulfobotulus alkaliphilus]
MKKKTIQEKGAFRNNLLLSLGILVFFCIAGAVQAAEKPQPPPRFQEVEGSNGSIVRDNNTGLEWHRCAYGESWTGSGCSGTIWEGKWDDAVRITASGGFRLPTIDELKTLAPYDLSIFPGDYYFWSSSPDVGHSNFAWGLHFNDGRVHYYGRKPNYGQVRLVRVGQ